MNLHRAKVIFSFILLLSANLLVAEALEPASLPARIQAQDYTSASAESDARSGAQTGVCSVGDVDMQVTNDNDGVCFVGWTRPGEWLSFAAAVNSDAQFDIVLRMASAKANKRVTVELNGETLGTRTSPSKGWNNFEDVVIENVAFPTGDYTLRVIFDTGAVNLNYIEIKDRSGGGFVNPFASFNFDFSRLAPQPEGQFRVLRDIGYTGLTMNVRLQEHRALLDRYNSINDDYGLKIHAGYMIVRFDRVSPKFFRDLDGLLDSLNSAGAAFWLIVGNNNLSYARNLEIIEQIADKAREKSVEFILYPHAGTKIETAEQALAYIEDLGRDDVYLSIHLTHEIRAGNGDRLTDTANKVQAYLRLPSISGSDVDYQDDVRSRKTIQPLYKGTYKPIKLLQALKSIDYRGPIVLHTFGLTSDERAPADHHHRSFDHYLELQSQLQ